MQQPPNPYGPQNPYAAPNPQAQSPYGAPQQFAHPNYGQPPPQANGAFAGAVGIAPVAIVAIGAAGAFPILNRFLLGPIANAARAYWVHTITNMIQMLLILVAVIFHLVWLHRVTTAVRATQGTSAYTPGFAVGSWFIPFANFFFPYATLADVWRRVTKDGGGLVALWWGCYLVTTFLRMFFQLVPTLGLDMSRTLIDLLIPLGWVLFLLHLGCFGVWIFIIRTMSEAVSKPRTF